MKLTKWENDRMLMPMMEDENGTLYCTSSSLCQALQINESTLRSVYERHSDEFSELSVSNCNAKEFLQGNRASFGIQRVRDDLRIWTEDDMLMFAVLSKSNLSKEFRKDFIKFMKMNARRGYVSREEYEALATRFSDLEDHINYIMPSLKASASAAGVSLSAHRKTKGLRS
jgi:hypothetical protein